MIELKFVKGLFIFGTLYDLDDCIPFSPAWDLLWLGSLSGFSCEIPSINAAFSQDCSIGSDHHLKSNDFEHLLLLLWPITSYRRFRKFLKFWSYFVKSRGSDINRFEQMITSSWREFLLFQYSQLTVSLCSRNFQNAKLRLDFVEIWWFYATQTQGAQSPFHLPKKYTDCKKRIFWCKTTWGTMFTKGVLPLVGESR